MIFFIDFGTGVAVGMVACYVILMAVQLWMLPRVKKPCKACQSMIDKGTSVRCAK